MFCFGLLWWCVLLVSWFSDFVAGLRGFWQLVLCLVSLLLFDYVCYYYWLGFICVDGLGLGCFAGGLEWFGFGVLGLLLVCCCVWMLFGLLVGWWRIIWWVIRV